jgi:hypothetical protein
MSLFFDRFHQHDGVSIRRLHFGVPVGAIFRSRLRAWDHRELKLAPTGNVSHIGGDT